MKEFALVCLIASLIACANINGKEQSLVEKQATHQISDSLKPYVAFAELRLALKNATIIDGTGKAALTKQTILIEDGLFKVIGGSKEIDIPDGYKTIDMSGKTIIPGIVGVHNHLHIPGFRFIGDVAAKLYFASGVTTIQTCGAAAAAQEIALADKIAVGEKIGPEVITSGPYFTGAGGNQNMIIPRNEQHIRDTMAHWIEQGVSWFKVYRHTKPADFKVIVEEAHKNGCKVSGHFCSITFEEAVKMGVDGIEHGLNSAADFRTDKKYGSCGGGRAYMDELVISSEEVIALQRLMIDSNVFLTSTLSIYETSVPGRAFADERSLQAMSPYLVQQYEDRRKQHDQNPPDSIRENRLKRIMAFDYQFFKMGGLLGSGADAGRHNMPGYGDQRNFELLKEAGFTTAEAIQVMTANGAQILDRTDIGSIAVGKRADFVVLDIELENDLSDIRPVEYVFKEGIGYYSEQIIAETNGKVGL